MTHLARVLRLTLGLIAIAAPLACAAAAAPSLAAPPRPFDVQHYDVQLTPDLQSRSVKGRAQIEFRVLAPVSEIELDAGALVIDSVHDGTRALPFAAANGRLRVSWPAPLPARSARTIAIAYHGTPRNGLTFIPEREQIYTVFSTSQWMPAIDAPDERATWRLELTLPAAWSADASGDLIGRKELGGGRAIHEWRQRAPVPSYTLGFAAGRFLAVDDGAARPALRYMGDGFSALELRQVFRDTRNMLDFFESRAGVPYPGKSYTQTLTAQGIGQEMAGLAVMPESYGRGVLADERESWLGAHEAAHQWWGNLVTCRDWRHFWLNEGFATFMVAAHKEHRFGRADYDREIGRIRARYERVRDAGRDRPLVFPDWDRPTAEDRTIVYQKGAYVLHLLREHLGDETFWQGIRAYTRKHAGQSVATQDFQAAMERAAGRSLDGFFQQWVYGPLQD